MPAQLPSPPWRTIAILWLLIFGTIVVLQSTLGALKSDLGGDPDEAAHAVTSLMIRDYLVEAPGTNPMAFAKAYYEKYPKVALGHYPPGYYLLAGVALLPAVSIKVLFILQAALIATTAAFIVLLGRQFTSLHAAVAASLLWAFSAPVYKLQFIVMSDVFLTLLFLCALACFARFMVEKKAMWSLGFGVFAAASILTKGSAWCMALVPAFAVLISRDWRLCLKPALWVAPIPVILLALPWQIYSLGITKEGMSDLTVGGHFKHSIPFYLQSFTSNYGWPVAVLFAITIVAFVLGIFKKQSQTPAQGESTRSVMWAFLAATVVILITIPTGVSPRYLIPFSIAAFLLTFDQAATWVAGRLRSATAAHLGVTCLLAASVATGVLSRELTKDVTGFVTAMGEIKAKTGQELKVILVCSDPRGEGALVAAAAFDPDYRALQSLRILRASKELSEIDWMGRGSDQLFSNQTAVLEHLDKQETQWVVIDHSVPQGVQRAYYAQLESALKSAPTKWEPHGEMPVRRDAKHSGHLAAYRRKQ